MQHIPVNSSAIESVAYDKGSGEMHVRFTSGRTYSYSGVDELDHHALINAESVGAHFSKHIRPHHPGRLLS